MIQLSALRSAPADCRTVASRTPVHAALLIRFPPTSLLTHSNVTNPSTVARARRSAYDYVDGSGTNPPTERSQVPTPTAGSMTVVVTTQHSDGGVGSFENR